MTSSGNHEARRQVVQRGANELAARGTPGTSGGRLSFACECGDGACDGHVEATRAEYEAVREYGSRFLIVRNHENAETSVVVSTHARYDVVESLTGEPRRIALIGNPRDDWPRGS